MLFEACVDSVASARNAVLGGATRLELCASLVEGGVTPSLGMVEAVVAAAAPCPVRVLVRPRGGDFCYTRDELRVMLRDVGACAAAGAAGVVVGALTPDGTLDEAVLRELVAAARAAGVAVTLHRAVDAAQDPLEALLAALRVGGFDAVLTSGGAPTAVEGAGVIARMVKAASVAGGVTVVAGGGVTPTNARALVAATGVRALHGTARGAPCPGLSRFVRDPPLVMGSRYEPSRDTEYGTRETSADAVAAILAAAAEGGVL